MNTLENIENLVEQLAGRVETLLGEREEMLVEIGRLRDRLVSRDKEAVKDFQDMQLELEAARENALRSEQERQQFEARLQNLNDRLIALVQKSCGA